jgi:hypothetical protein
VAASANEENKVGKVLMEGFIINDSLLDGTSEGMRVWAALF